jgi:transaldolase
MEFFFRTANVEQLKKPQHLAFVDGVKTNPTLLQKKVVKSQQAIMPNCKNNNGPFQLKSMQILAMRLFAAGESYS